MSLREHPPAGVGFYGGPFSNFQITPIHLPHPYPFSPIEETVIYPTVEHRYQAMKASYRADHDAIAGQPTPGAAKRRGQSVRLRPDWEEIKYAVMLQALREKFKLEQYRAYLINTGHVDIYENSPTDAVWGLWNPKTQDWTGLNLLGRALMQIRDELTR